MSGARLALQFPGQGSQFVGMGRSVHDAFAESRAAFEETDEALGSSLSRLCFEGDEEELRRTENTQPALLVTSIAVYRALAARGLHADWFAGHSLGEYSALVAAGSLDLGAAARLVRARGRFMQEAVPEGEGSMAAILGLDDAAVQEVCREAAGDGVVEPANYNAPGQVVIAGTAAAVDRAIEVAKAAGARRALPLNVSAPFHCSLMAPAAERLADELAAIEIRDPSAPVVDNVTATGMTSADVIREALARQVTAPVRWAEGLQWLVEAGAERLVEVGPGKVLGGLAKRTVKGVELGSVHEADEVLTMTTGSEGAPA